MEAGQGTAAAPAADRRVQGQSRGRRRWQGRDGLALLSRFSLLVVTLSWVFLSLAAFAFLGLARYGEASRPPAASFFLCSLLSPPPYCPPAGLRFCGKPPRLVWIS
jgi:hypothetical protein